MSIVTPHATVLLEFSRDPLSDTTPTWIDITAYLKEVEWSDGKSGDLDEPQAGSMTLQLKNTGRRFEPEYVAGAYYPDIVPLRRFRLSLNGTPEFFGYATGYDISYPGGTAYSEVAVQCVDGFGLLSLDALDLLDPSSASSVEEVVMHDEPLAYYKLGEKAGTKMEPVTGPEGVYFNTPLLNQEGLVLGDSDPSVEFRGAQSEYGRAPLADVGQFADTNAMTIEALVRPTSVASDFRVMAGPHNTTLGDSPIYLTTDGGTWRLVIAMVSPAQDIAIASTTAPSTGRTDHVCGTYDGNTARLYVNGVEEASMATSGTIRQGSANQFLYVGRSGIGGALYANARIQHAAFFEYALIPDRVEAHWLAFKHRGFGAGGTAGQRIAAVAASALWSEAGIQTTGHEVQPVMEHGQSKLAEINAAVKAEMPMSLFFFDGSGNPDYLGWDYRGTGPYNEPAAIFGDTSSEVPYSGIELVYDDDLFNEVTVSHQTASDGEASHTVTDQTSIDAYYRRAHAETGLILVDHEDAIAVAAAILSSHKDPQFRVESLSLNGANTPARTQILTRQLGDCVRVKRRGEGGTPVDVITWVIGRNKRLDVNGHLWATLQTARGFNAALADWQIGVVGFSEIGQTTVLG